MKDSLDRNFILQVGLFILLISVISAVALSALSLQRIYDSDSAEFLYELKIDANQLNYKILIARENVKALSSRTMIRQELSRCNSGEISLSDLSAFTQPKFEDGACVYTNLLFALRTDLQGNIIATYNLPEDFQWKTIGREISIIKQDSYYIVIIKNGIIHHGNVIGYDYAAFELENPDDLTCRFCENIQIIDQDRNNSISKKTGQSVSIGDSGYHLYAELNQKIISEDYKSIIGTIIIQVLLLILTVVLISYFTILKLTKKSIKKLNIANKMLIKQERYEAITDISGGIAHSFNNILAGIMGYAELLISDREISQPRKKMAGEIVNLSEKAAFLISQLMDFGQKNFLDVRNYNLSVLLNEAVNSYEKESGVRSRKAVTVFKDSIEIEADQLKINQLVRNLLHNSEEADSQIIKINIDQIHLPDELFCDACNQIFSGDWNLLEFIDDGKGISRDVRPHIFEPFYTDKIKHSGLGLSQVYGIINQSRGHLTLTSSPKHGTTVRIYFPIPAKESVNQKN